ncbi:MAG: hypothetical protein EYC69_09670 [Bacteroidetes bacterium]|nr:MAG: hypothetical protein EYC69_09670 [Bacteroidota bacterium]
MKNTSLFLGAGVLICTFLMSCSTQTKDVVDDKPAMNKATMSKIYEAFNSGNTADLGNLVDANLIEHQPDPNIKETGLEGLKKTIDLYRSSFPDLKMNVLSMTAEGDLVTTHFNMSGTNSGPMGEMPATNKTMNIDGVDIIKFKDGKAVEHWGYYEEMKMMEQLGLMQEPAGMPMDPASPEVE